MAGAERDDITASEPPPYLFSSSSAAAARTRVSAHDDDAEQQDFFHAMQQTSAATTTTMSDNTEEPPSRSHTPTETPEHSRYRHDLIPRASLLSARDQGSGSAQKMVRVQSPAPLPDSSSFFETTSIDQTMPPDDFVSEERLRAHLKDVESSFLPSVSPILTGSTNTHGGIDDTFVFDSPRKAPAQPNHPPPFLKKVFHHEPAPEPEPEPAPEPELGGAVSPDMMTNNTTSSMRTYDTSPTNASAAGSHLRSASMRRITRSQNAHFEDAEHEHEHEYGHGHGHGHGRAHGHGHGHGHGHEDSSADDYENQPSPHSRDRNYYYHNHNNYNQNNNRNRNRNRNFDRNHDRDRDHDHELDQDPFDDHSMPQTQGFSRKIDSSSSNNNTPGFSLRGSRPKFLHSRYGSTQSSTSSFATNSDSHEESDATVGLGVDFALQSGGAVPNVGMPRAPTNLLPRPMSIGSLTSGTDEYPEATTDMTTNQLEPLAELDSPDRSRDSYLMRTPKARKTITTAPTDVVIAQHVKKVHVPESLAKEYKSKNGLETPRGSTGCFTGTGTGTGTGNGNGNSTKKPGRNLTLKEQSGTIERLSKENFDLKLKVMFLSDRLDKLSEEGIKEMIAENVELKTGLALCQRDNKLLRRRVKELQKQVKDENERPSTARSTTSSTDKTFQEEAQEKEEELIFLRQRVEEYAEEIERLQGESINRESEKRKLADIVKVLGERTGDNLGRQEEADVWKDLLEQENARREQSDEENRRLRDEIFRLKKEISGNGVMHHTTNIYNITKKPRDRDRLASPTRPMSGLSGDADGSLANLSAATTLVEELRREGEQLRHENAELRREVGAQTSMLTSRNREKERLYQEIEDLKMAQRRGGPAPSTIDSLLDRSASRAGGHERPPSRGSMRTRTVEEESEREEMENQMAELRDKVSEVKLQNQDLQRELENCMMDFEAAVNNKREAEDAMMGLQEELDTATNDLIALQSERDEALRETAELEQSFEMLQGEAQDEVNALEGEIERLQADLNDRSENFESLQDEMRKMSEALLGLEDEQEHKLRHIQELEDESEAKLHRIQHLEQELESSNKELEELEQKLMEANEKNQRLSVQQESSQGEIAFLREEQEADKIRIGDLEAAFSNAEQAIHNEKERVAELENQLHDERQQWEAISKSKESDAQQIFNDLSREAAGAKDEVRRLRKSLSSREVEATEWKERLLELENNLREALGDLNGTRSSLLKSIARMQRELENTIRELDTTKAALMEKDRIIKQRDSLLESHALESRKVTELLEKERAAHRNTKSSFETFQKTHLHLSRTASTQDIRISELEATRGQDRRKIALLEQTAREQLLERNELLLLLWQRLSALCGREWANSNTLIDRQVVASLEVITNRLPGFSKNLLSAVKTIEDMFGTLQSKVKSVEKDLFREYQTLENNLDSRVKKLDRLETMVRNSVSSGSIGTYDASRMARLEEAYRQLKVENATLKTANDVRSRAAHQTPGGSDGSGGSPSPLVPRGPGDRDRERVSRSATQSKSSRPQPPTRGVSTSGIPTSSSKSGLGSLDAHSDGSLNSNNDNRWLLRLRDMEYKLKMEREARNQDRQAARQRLGGLETENKDLREKMRRANSNTTD